MSIVSVRSLSYTYPGSDEPALIDVSLELRQGEYMAIVGANGSGKSTLVRCLNGLLPPPPGSVSVGGFDPSGVLGRMEARKVLSLVFQSPQDQIVSSVVEEDVAFGLENLGIPHDEMLLRVPAALLAVDLLEERSRSPRFLSAGQQQRLAVAGVLAMAPRVVAFDEATSMIDPVGRHDVLSLMDDLVSDGVAVIHVTHDMDEVARAGRVAVLDSGRLAFLGSPSELFAREDLRSLRLARPRSYTAAIALGLPPLIAESAAALGLRATSDDTESTRHDRPSMPRQSLQPTLSSQPGVDSAFTLHSVSMSYILGTESERLAVDDLSMSLPSGSLVALVGKTGSGKSSLLQLLDGLALPDEGRVVSFGMDTRDRTVDLRQLRMRAPLAIQRPESAIFESYVGDEVAFGPKNQGLKGPALVSRVRMAMDTAGLPFSEYRDASTRTLSGGRKRKLALASILSLDPDVLLLDEPTAALDPASREEILSMIQAFAGSHDVGADNNKRVRTVIMSTHSMEEAALAELVAVMQGGRLVAYGPPTAVFGTLWDASWGIERPFSYELNDAIAPGGQR